MKSSSSLRLAVSGKVGNVEQKSMKISSDAVPDANIQTNNCQTSNSPKSDNDNRQTKCTASMNRAEARMAIWATFLLVFDLRTKELHDEKQQNRENCSSTQFLPDRESRLYDKPWKEFCRPFSGRHLHLR